MKTFRRVICLTGLRIDGVWTVIALRYWWRDPQQRIREGTASFQRTPATRATQNIMSLGYPYTNAFSSAGIRSAEPGAWIAAKFYDRTRS